MSTATPSSLSKPDLEVTFEGEKEKKKQRPRVNGASSEGVPISSGPFFFFFSFSSFLTITGIIILLTYF